LTIETAPALHADIGRAISHAVIEVFSTMLATEVTGGEAVIRKSEPEYHSNVVALLGLTGDWSGSGQLAVEPAFACRIASLMLMAEYDAVNEDVLDAVAEIANMVIGNIKNELEPRLGPMGLSTPTIVFGGDFGTRVAGSPERVIMPFTCPDGTMHVQILLAPRHNEASLHRLRAHMALSQPLALSRPLELSR
jgi:chemotaxis protein CheX